MVYSCKGERPWSCREVNPPACDPTLIQIWFNGHFGSGWAVTGKFQLPVDLVPADLRQLFQPTNWGNLADFLPRRHLHGEQR